jgi:hypothetical protein
MARLIYKTGPHPGLAVDLRPGVNRVGRNPANEIQILDSSVSGFHCEILVSGAIVSIRDVGSRNGTYLDGARITKEILEPGKVLRVGMVDFDLDVPEAKVAIPERPKKEEVFANFLEDGSPACQNHGTVAATQKCLKCEKTWCEECVRKTGLVGSANRMVTCIECGGACTPIVFTPVKKKSIFDKIGETLWMKKPKR